MTLHLRPIDVSDAGHRNPHRRGRFRRVCRGLIRGHGQPWDSEIFTLVLGLLALAIGLTLLVVMFVRG